MPMIMQEAYLEIRHADEDDVRRVPLEQNEVGYQAQAYFYEEGDYQLRMMGILRGHTIVAEFGEYEVSVERQRQLIGSYWVEVEIAGGPVLENSDRQIRLLVYDLLPDGTRGSSISSLTVTASVHAPGGDEAESRIADEGNGAYSLAHAFGHAGGYRVHVAIDAGGSTLEGEFYIPVHDPGEFDGGTADDSEGAGAGGH